MREKLAELLMDCDCPYPCKAADQLIENGVTIIKWNHVSMGFSALLRSMAAAI